MFFYVHAMLSHAANLSKLLWPIPPRKKSGESKPDYTLRVTDQETRGQELRTALNVPDDSVPQNRIVRDHFEHYDERLEEFVRTGGEAGVLDMALASPETLPRDSVTRHRSFAPWVMTIYYQSDEMSLILVADAIRNLRNAARKWVFDRNGWDRDDPDAWYNKSRWSWERKDPR